MTLLDIVPAQSRAMSADVRELNKAILFNVVQKERERERETQRERDTEREGYSSGKIALLKL